MEKRVQENFLKYIGIVWMAIVGLGIVYGFIRFLFGLKESDWLTFLIIFGIFFIGAIVKLFRRVSSLEERVDRIKETDRE